MRAGRRDGRAARSLCTLRKEELSISKTKKTIADSATSSIAKPTHTDVEKVVVARDIVATAKKNPGWATAKDLQAAAAVWSQSADDIEANAAIVITRKSDLRTAEAKQLSLRRVWVSAKKQVMGTVDVLCAGSGDEIKAYGLDVRARVSLGPLAVPEDLATKPGKAQGQVRFSWAKGFCRHGFLVQHATDTANVATYSSVIPCTKSKFMLSGATSGATMSFRVAAVDPSSSTGMTAWSSWVAGTVR